MQRPAQRVRVGIDYRPALLGRAGLGRATRELVRALAEDDDVELHLFGHCFRGAQVAGLPPAHTRLHRLPLPGKGLRLLAKCGLHAGRLAGNPQVFHWTDTVFPPVSDRQPTVVTVHDLAFLADPGFHGEAAAKGLAHRVLAAARRASICVVPSMATADALREALADEPHPKRIEVIPFGSDHVHRTTREPHGLKVIENNFFVALGTIEPRKNHQRLLDAWTALDSPKPDLVVVGHRGWQCEKTCEALQRLAKETSNKQAGTGRLIWQATLSDGQVASLLDTARALVYPSLLEGFGFPPLEAMAVGLPVLTGHHAALRDVAGGAALVVDAEDTAAIRTGLEQLANRPELGESLVQKGLQRAQQFTWAACAASYKAIYREVASWK